ncbi:MAG TPA: hypothetical protein VI455_00155 [Terriglobia bacterium]
MKAEGRLPPLQAATLKWPVLRLGNVPRFDPETWDLRTAGWVKTSLRLMRKAPGTATAIKPTRVLGGIENLKRTGWRIPLMVSEIDLIFPNELAGVSL